MYPYYETLVIITISALLPSKLSAFVVNEALEDHLKGIAHKDSAELIKHEKQKGENLHQLDSEINDNHKNRYSKTNDEGKYLKKDYDSKTSKEGDEYNGHNAQQDKAEGTESTGYKRGHKKGHHKQGFQNSYHKDESSNNSSYFDDLNDEGDQTSYNTKLNSHDRKGGRTYHGSHNNGQEQLRDNYRGANYNRYGDAGNKHQNYQGYGKKYYLDDALNYNKHRNGRDSYDRGNSRDYHKYRAPELYHEPVWQTRDDRRGWVQSDWRKDFGWHYDPRWERDSDRGVYYDDHGYYDDHSLRHDGGYDYIPHNRYGYNYDESRMAPVSEIPSDLPVVGHRKHTITIYEDPRYDGKELERHLLREEGDYVHLDFKPSHQRYAAASNDHAVYHSPTREGVKGSKINRLIYNYKKQ